MYLLTCSVTRCTNLLFCFVVLIWLYTVDYIHALFENVSKQATQVPAVNITELGTYLEDLDAKIMKMVIFPQQEQGDELLKNMEIFWKNLRYLDGLVVLSEQPAFRPAKYLIEQECPKFVQEAFDMFNLQNTFGWDADTFRTFRDYLLLIAGLASRLPDDFAKMRVDVETLFEKPLVQQ